MTSHPVFTDSGGSVEAPRRATMLADVRASLSRSPRELPSKYFYDAHGSRLFERITALPEYYLTRSEREILEVRSDEIVAHAPRALVEFGAGSAAKTRILLSSMLARTPQVTYVPVDVNAEFLHETRCALEAEMIGVCVEPITADLTGPLGLPHSFASPALFAFLGSTIGNFEAADAIDFLRRVRSHMRSDDRFLLGTDLRKDRATLEAAYNDNEGVTAEFNRNILRVLNRELRADFVPDRFLHEAFYNSEAHRIEMHLRSSVAHLVHIPGMPTLALREGESLRTEVSYKYDRDAVEAMADSAGLLLTSWYNDSQGRFALSVLAIRQ